MSQNRAPVQARERYRIRIIQNQAIRYEAEVDAATHTVPEAVWDDIRHDGAFTLAVAQLSDQFGPGPYAMRNFNV